MMAAKEAIAEEEDDDVPGKLSIFEISERISCCFQMVYITENRRWLWQEKINVLAHTFIEYWCYLDHMRRVLPRMKHWYCLLFPLTDLVENFDEASKNEANWFFIPL